MILKIVNAEYAGEYKLSLEYNNGAKVLSDLSEALREEKRVIFEPIKDLAGFKNFALEHGTVVWNGELDIAPEFLLYHSTSRADDKTSIDTIGYAKSLYQGAAK